MEFHRPLFKNGKSGITLAIRVFPGSKKDEITAVMEDGRVKVRLTATPIEGKANRALVQYLAGILRIPASNIVIVAGTKSRNKIVSINGLDSNPAEELILDHLPR